jgi:thiol-disulfide isomerase/thioredoxin
MGPKVNFGLLMVICLMTFSCETREQVNGIKLTMDFPEADSLVVKIIHSPILESENLAELNLHTINNASIQFELSKPLMSTLIINGHGHKLYLKPGYDLKIYRDTTASFESILFEGEGALMNNYINHVSNILMSEELLQYDMNFDSKTFARKYDSLKVLVQNFSKSYLNRFSLPDDDLELLKRIDTVQFLSIKAGYAVRAHETYVMDQIFKLEKGETVSTITMPEEPQNIFPVIPFDAAYLKEGLFDYKLMLSYYLREKHISTYKFAPPGERDLQWPRRSHELIKVETFPAEIKEYLIASDLRDWMTFQGRTIVIDSIMDEFKRDFKGSIYITSLQKSLGEDLDSLTGNIAPDFRGTNIKGKPISLKDFRGKVVYVDLWATWCAPCLEQIPYAKKLHSAFEKDEVTFLNVSVDKNPDAWRKMLAEENDWLGTHIILDKQEVDSLTKNYQVDGYPKYILIDKTGKVVSADASRPSSEKIKDEIRSLLK